MLSPLVTSGDVRDRIGSQLLYQPRPPLLSFKQDYYERQNDITVKSIAGGYRWLAVAKRAEKGH
jgi:hypothetical protein